MKNSTQDPEVSAHSTQHTAHSIQIPKRVEPLLREVGRIADDHGVSAYAVGGCVRDWLLGRAGTSDLDVTVEGSGIELAQAVSRAMRATLTTHQQFGTATMQVHPALSRKGGVNPTGRTRPLRVDFASCRREVYTRPAAYPSVSPGTLEEDLCRRDFTINAMALAISPGRFGIMIDPSHGLQDLRRKVLRALHERSFLDDPSRILRGIRFAQRFGLRWEPRTERAAREAIAAGALGRLNAGRFGKELDRMCDEPDPKTCFEQLAELLNTEAQGSGLRALGTGRRPQPRAPSPERS